MKRRKDLECLAVKEVRKVLLLEFSPQSDIDFFLAGLQKKIGEFEVVKTIAEKELIFIEIMLESEQVSDFNNFVQQYMRVLKRKKS